jgi:hypothetical protein
VLRLELGFEAKSGWLFDMRFDGGKVLIPTLQRETKIVFERDDVRLHLVYDSVISPASEENQEEPLSFKVAIHDRPDARLDVFQGGVYAGSIIVDFKYRPLAGRYKFWQPDARPKDRPHTTRQLIMYKSDSTSRSLFGGKVPQTILRQVLPVVEVWAMYPTDPPEGAVQEWDERHGVRLVRACPGEDISHIGPKLEAAIGAVLEQLDYYVSLA